MHEQQDAKAIHVNGSMPPTMSGSSGRNTGTAILHSMLELLPMGLLLVDAQRRVHLQNGRFRELIGQGQEFLNEPVLQLPFIEQVGMQQELQLLLGNSVPFDREFEIIGQDGRLRVCLMRGFPLTQGLDYSGFHLILLEDVTHVRHLEGERRKLQIQLDSSQRMESFGLLAAGIAHDLNNVLACILGSSDILIATSDEGSQSARLADQISHAAQQGAEMTHKVLRYSRGDDLERQAVDVNHAVREMMVLLRRSIDPRIEIEMVLEAERRVVSGSPTLIHQVLMNLGVNARDAMPSGGTLRVHTLNLSAEGLQGELAALSDREGFPRNARRRLTSLFEEHQELIVLIVEDTGTGIETRYIERVFEPFFTTKPLGEGTGLGLPMVRKAVHDMDGIITVHSKPGAGSCFKIYMPVAEEGHGSVKLREQERQLVKGKGRILLVDDDEVIRSTTSEMLGHLGYEVLTAEDGVAAVETFRQESCAFDLVLLDLMMPRMDGIETLRRILSLKPEQSVLVATGFANDTILADLTRIADVPVMYKPFSFTELSKRVAELVQ